MIKPPLSFRLLKENIMRLFTSLRSPPSRLFSIKKQSGLSSHDYMRRHVNDSYVKKAQKVICCFS